MKIEDYSLISIDFFSIRPTALTSLMIDKRCHNYFYRYKDQNKTLIHIDVRVNSMNLQAFSLTIRTFLKIIQKSFT